MQKPEAFHFFKSTMKLLVLFGLVFGGLILFVFLPDRKAAAIGQSRLYAHFREYPFVENEPDGKDAEDAEYFHFRPPDKLYFDYIVESPVQSREFRNEVAMAVLRIRDSGL